MSALAFDGILALDSHAARLPAAPALTAPGRKAIPFGELPERLREIRRELAACGLRAGEVAALALPNSPELILAFLAICGIGASAPLNPALTESEFRLLLGRLGARVVLVPGGAPSAAALAARSLGNQVLEIHSISGGAAGDFSIGRMEHDVIGTAGAGVSLRQSDAALLLFTSATTSRPKLVPITSENLRAMAVRETGALRLTSEDRFLSLMPLFHLHGIAAVLAQLACGGAVCITAGFHPAAFLDWIEQFQPTWFSSASPINRAILTLAREHREVFRRSPLRMIRTTGATPSPEILDGLEEAAGVPVLNGYGLTETGGVTRSTPGARKPGSVGRSSGLEIAIEDPLGNILEAESEGEVIIRGPSVTSGYLDEPEANIAAFRGGWFHTGDLGRLDRDGFLFLTGRVKEMINRAGEKIAPMEVEDVLAAHPAVADAAVFAVHHPTLGEDIAAAVVLRAGASASVLELRQFAITKLAAFKVPRRFVFLDAIPRTVTGKPRRAALEREFQDRAELLRDELRRDEIRPEDIHREDKR